METVGPPADVEGDIGSHAEEEVASSGHHEEDPMSMQAVLRLIAETQKMMMSTQSTGQPIHKARILATVKIPEFDGSQMTTVRRYREWRKAVDIIHQ